jgi:hypothetical protein
MKQSGSRILFMVFCTWLYKMKGWTGHPREVCGPGCLPSGDSLVLRVGSILQCYSILEMSPTDSLGCWWGMQPRVYATHIRWWWWWETFKGKMSTRTSDHSATPVTERSGNAVWSHNNSWAGSPTFLQNLNVRFQGFFILSDSWHAPFAAIILAGRLFCNKPCRIKASEKSLLILRLR